MTSRDCVRRLQREYQKLLKEPPTEFVALPNAENILEWHYIIEGPEGTPYHGGTYHGKLKFPEQYPHKPPAIMMITPSGRFVPETRLCLSYSDFHPETWNPMWNVSTILTGLISFMTSNEDSVGTVSSTDAVKRAYAKASMEYNLKNPVFRKHFESRCNDSAISSSSPASSSAPSIAEASSSSSAPEPKQDAEVQVGANKELGTAPATAEPVPTQAKPAAEARITARTAPRQQRLQDAPQGAKQTPPPQQQIRQQQQPLQQQQQQAVRQTGAKKRGNSTGFAILALLVVALLAIYANRLTYKVELP